MHYCCCCCCCCSTFIWWRLSMFLLVYTLIAFIAIVGAQHLFIVIFVVSICYDFRIFAEFMVNGHPPTIPIIAYFHLFQFLIELLPFYCFLLLHQAFIPFFAFFFFLCPYPSTQELVYICKQLLVQSEKVKWARRLSASTLPQSATHRMQNVAYKMPMKCHKMGQKLADSVCLKAFN